jgi:hypothetical protein
MLIFKARLGYSRIFCPLLRYQVSLSDRFGAEPLDFDKDL